MPGQRKVSIGAIGVSLGSDGTLDGGTAVKGVPQSIA